MTISSVRADHLAVAQEYASCPDTWPMAPRFNPRERWYARIAGDAAHEAWLVTWLPGQGVELHDHGGAGGAFTVVTGELTEQTVATGPGAPWLVTTRLATGDGKRFGPRYVHRVHNNGDRPAVSVHVYSPALRVMRRYQLTDGGLTVVGTDVAGVAW